jgi:repressor LexA
MVFIRNSKNTTLVLADSIPKRYCFGMQFPNRIRQMRESRKLSQQKLAELVGTSQPQINRLETGERGLDQSWLFKLAQALRCQPADLLPAVADEAPGMIPVLRVRFVGDVQAGVFREALEWEEDRQYDLDMPVEPAFHRYPVFGLEVYGDSMNRIFPHGTKLACVRLLDLGDDFELESGKYVVVLRHVDHGLDKMEATVKQYEVDQNRTAWLWPRSDNPEFQSPIKVLDTIRGELDETVDRNDEIRIWALVIGFYRAV